MSYSHAADREIGAQFQRHLERIAKPWYVPRGMEVFRDETDLTANPDLWREIRAALARSTYFVLLASPQAARSPWVRREVRLWCRLGRAERLLIALTDGNVAWGVDSSSTPPAGFEWPRTTALPDVLARAFKREPLWVDLREARRSEDLSSSNPQFFLAVARVAARVRGLELRELVSEDYRQHRRTIRTARVAAGALALLAFAAIVGWVLATRRGDEAQAQTALAHRTLLGERGRLASSLAQARRGLEAAVTATDALHDVLVERRSSVESVPSSLTEGLSRALDQLHERERIAVPGERLWKGWLSPNEATVLGVTNEGTAYFFDASNGRELRRYRPQWSPISVSTKAMGGAFSASGKLALLWALDDEARLLHLDGREMRLKRPKDTLLLALVDRVQIVRAEFFPTESRVLLVRSDRRALVHDASSGSIVWDSALDRVRARSCAISARGDLFLLDDEQAGSIHVYDSASLKQTHELTGVTGAPHSVLAFVGSTHVMVGESRGDAVLYELNGAKRIASYRAGHGVIAARAYPELERVLLATVDQEVRTFSLWTGELLAAFRLSGEPKMAYEFDASGRHCLVSEMNGSARVVNVAAPEVFKVLRGLGGPLFSARFSASGRHVLATSPDSTIRLFDLVGRTPDLRITTPTPIARLSFSPDGSTAWTADSRGLVVGHDMHTGAVSSTLALDVPFTASILPISGRTIATIDAIGALRVNSDGCLGDVVHHSSPAIRAVELSNDGRTLLVAGQDTTARLFDVATGRAQRVLTHAARPVHDGKPRVPGASVEFATFWDADRAVLTATADGFVHIHDVESGTEIESFEGSCDSLSFVRCAPKSNRVVHAGRDSFGGPTRLRLFDVGRRVALWELEAEARDAAVALDGSVAVIAVDNREVWGLDGTTGQRRYTLGDHDGPPRLALSTDGALLLTTCGDDLARLFDARTGEVLQVFGGHDGPVVAAGFVPDDGRVWTLGQDAAVHVHSTSVVSLARNACARLRSILDGDANHVDLLKRCDALEAALR